MMEPSWLRRRRSRPSPWRRPGAALDAEWRSRPVSLHCSRRVIWTEGDVPARRVTTVKACSIVSDIRVTSDNQ